MTDAEKYAFAVAWFEAGQCPGCFAPLEAVAGVGSGHSVDTHKPRGGGPRGGMCDWSADDLASLCLIGSGTVGYHPDTDVSNRTPAGETAPSRENTPTQVASLTCHCQGGGQHES